MRRYDLEWCYDDCYMVEIFNGEYVKYDDAIKEREKWIRLGFNIAIENVEISEDDGWQRTSPFIDTIEAKKKLKEQIKKLEGK